MPRNGYGTLVLPTGNPVAVGDTLTADIWNNTMSDLAQGVSNSLPVDGQRTPSANLPMGGYRHTGCGDGVAATDYATVGQVPKISKPIVVIRGDGTQNVPSINGITNTKITIYASAVKNYGTWWSVANHKFTPNIPGWYLINACVHCQNNPTSTSADLRAMIEIYLNGSVFARGQDSTYVGSKIHSLQVSYAIYLNGNTDYVEIYIKNVSSEIKSNEIILGSAGTFADYFQAILIGAD